MPVVAFEFSIRRKSPMGGGRKSQRMDGLVIQLHFMTWLTWDFKMCFFLENNTHQIGQWGLRGLRNRSKSWSVWCLSFKTRTSWEL